MKRLLVSIILPAALLGSAFSQQGARRPMTVDDGLDMVYVRDVVMSPDGRNVLFAKSEKDWSKKKRKTTYFMVPAAGGEAYQFIGEAGGSSPQFSPDGQYLSFKRTVDKKQQLFIMRTTGGEAVALTKQESGVGDYKWAPDSRRIFFIAPREQGKEQKKLHEAGYDEIVVDEGPNGQDAGTWQDFWVIDLDNKQARRLTHEDSRLGDFDVSPDGGRIVYTARFENRRNQQNLSEIYLLNLADSSISRLTNNRAPEGDLVWAPDGKRFAYAAGSDGEWELRNEKLWVMNADSREKKMISGEFIGNISGTVWMPDGKSLLFTGRQRTNSNLFRIDAQTGAITQLTKVDGTLRAASFSKDRSKMVYSFEDFDTPADLYASSTAGLKPVRLTDLNPEVATKMQLAQVQVISWKSKDGLEIEGLLALPADYVKGTKLPLLLHIHGGPAGAFTNSFRYSYHVWAGLGYAQLMPNVRGSSGYSDDFLRGNMHDIGGGDFQDLMTGVDAVIDRGYADPQQLGLRGWSYGGILGGWTITQTPRFKAASIGAMVADWTSEYGPGFNYDVRLWYIGGTPWDNPDEFRYRSALSHVKNITTPALLLHGINDRTDTEQQSMMFFTAIKDQGKTVRYIKFPREPHGFQEQRHQRTRDIEEIRWMQKYVRGIDWTPWEREEDKPKQEKPEAETKVTALPQ